MSNKVDHNGFVIKAVALPLSEYSDAQLRKFIAIRSQMVATKAFMDGEPIEDEYIGYYEQSVIDAKAELAKRGTRNEN